tara:strand:+ start:340 stop:822 length:483 start_codon:yes stop_codon:yes gene_type:complete
VEQNGFYCGDDESNWTQYSPLGCVPNGLGGIFYLNDGWEDCVDGSDEANAVPTTLADCGLYVESCDTVFVEIPVIEIITQTDTIVETIIETEYITDTIVEFQEIIITEYVDCTTGLPCNSGMQEVLNKSKNTGLLYDLNGRTIIKPEGIYIENGLIKYKL